MDIYFLQVYFIILSTALVISAGSTIWTLDNYENITRIKRQTACSEAQVGCQNGQCINEEQMCDGITDCNDGSDETKALCGTARCAKLFRCDYGACVNAQAECNGLKECADGSDENDCDGIAIPLSIKAGKISPPTSTPPVAGSCLMPKNPPNGFYTVGIYNIAPIKPGEHIPSYSVLVLKCDPWYRSSPPELNPTLLCLNGTWSITPPTCARYCSVRKLPSTIKLICKFNGTTLNSCDDAVEGTILSFECAPLYEQSITSNNPNRICRDGNWNYPLPQCVPVCGKMRPVERTASIGSPLPKISNYPWHVGIYSSSFNDGPICGGTIINERVILTAAHCVSDYMGQLKSKEDYLVGAGKYYKSYRDPRDIDAQYSKVHSIHKTEQYHGRVKNYESDIAVLILETEFKISKAVQPVCVDWNTNYESAQLLENNIGVIVGWSYSVLEGDPPDELQELKLPYKSYSDCYNNVPKNFKNFLTMDKICAGYLSTNKAVSQGQSGGGLMFPWLTDRYYIRGILSVSPTIRINGTVTADPNQYSTYTLVSRYIQFIRDLETYYSTM